MKFFVRTPSLIEPPAGTIPPCGLLVPQYWDDFGWRTSFELYLYMQPGRVELIGPIKILQKDSKRTSLPEVFEGLSKNFVSLGQTHDYYRNIYRYSVQIKRDILRALNDALYNKSAADDIQYEPGFSTSLLRGPEPSSLWAFGIEGIKSPAEEPFEFVFITQLPGASGEHRVPFKFLDTAQLPSRMNVLIGKNQTGKTSVLHNLASTIMGSPDPVGVFEQSRPPFSRVIGASFCVFDPFPPRDASSVPGSYLHCGIYDNDNKLKSRDRLLHDMSNTLRRLSQRTSKKGRLLIDREQMFYESIQFLLGQEATKRMREVHSSDLGKESWINESGRRLSSGQLAVLSLLTQIALHIEPHSLILLDEPENHLHPNAISGLMLSIDRLLKSAQSFAVVSTHSPFIVQQIPSKYCIVFRNIDGYPDVGSTSTETFGNNLSTICDEVFQVYETPSLFTEWAASSDRKAAEVDKLISLSMTAAAYVNSVRIP